MVGSKLKAFAAIEAIITIIIVSFLVTALVFIQGLSQSSNIQSQIVQIANFDAAIKQFRQKYNSLPGDTDSTIFFGLTKENTDGNSNSVIEDRNGGVKQASSEVVNFWRHLSESGFIKQKYDGLEKQDAKIGKTFPIAKIGNNRGITVFGDGDANYYQIGVIDSDKNKIIMSDKTLKASESLGIDMKIDDSIPRSGRVIAVGGEEVNQFSTNEKCVINDEYNRNTNEPSCQLRIQISTVGQ